MNGRLLEPRARNRFGKSRASVGQSFDRSCQQCDRRLMLCPQFGQRQFRYILLLSGRFHSCPGTRSLALHALPMLLRRQSPEQRRALLHEAFELRSRTAEPRTALSWSY